MGGIPPRKAYWCEVRQSFLLPLSGGQVALIDQDDVERLTNRCWSTSRTRHGIYAVCPQNIRADRGSQYLHRFVLGIGKAGHVRFRNGDTLDCRKKNLAHNEPLYVLEHGITVMAEVAPNKACPYWRVYILAHPLFSGKIVGSGWILVRRNRAVMTASLGRMLLRTEHVHHRSEDKADDSLSNLELLSPAAHNAHHKTGSKHSPAVRQKISLALAETYRAGAREVAGAAKAQMEKARVSLSQN